MLQCNWHGNYGKEWCVGADVCFWKYFTRFTLIPITHHQNCFYINFLLTALSCRSTLFCLPYFEIPQVWVCYFHIILTFLNFVWNNSTKYNAVAFNSSNRKKGLRKCKNTRAKSRVSNEIQKILIKKQKKNHTNINLV